MQYQNFRIVRQIFFDANLDAELKLLAFALGRRSSPRLPVLPLPGADSSHAPPRHLFALAPREGVKGAAEKRGFGGQRDGVARGGDAERGVEMRGLSGARDGTRHGVERRRRVAEEVGETGKKHERTEFPTKWLLEYALFGLFEALSEGGSATATLGRQ